MSHAKTLELEAKLLQQRVYDRMVDENTKGHKDEDGTTFTRMSKEYGQVRDRRSFVEWAIENEPELVQYKERGAELNAMVRQRLDDGEELPPGVDFYTRDTISIRSS